MLLFLADLPLNLSVYMAATGINAGDLRVYHYALFVRSVYDYYVPLLIAVGLLCNIVSVVVFANNSVGDADGSEDRVTSFASLCTDDSYDTYLSSRAVADSVFLLCLFVVWLDNVDIPVYTTSGWCQVRPHDMCFKRRSLSVSRDHS